jgi:Tol biopolymer transport system component
MQSQKVTPEQGSWNEHQQQRRRARNLRVGAIAVSACVVAAVVAALVVSGDEHAATKPPAGDAPAGTGQTLSIVDVGSGTTTAFTAPPGASEFDFSLDGSMVTYSSLDTNNRNQVFVMDADGSNPRQLTQGEREASNPEWSSDGSMIAYEGRASAISAIRIVRLSDGRSTTVTDEPRDAWDPTWGRDDGSILFSTPDASGHVLLAKSIDLATGQATTIVTHASLPALSPDGSKIVFDSYAKEPLIRLSLANIDGAKLGVIARSYGDGFAKWSPFGTQIAYIGDSGDEGLGTYVYDLAHGKSRFVTTGTIESWVDDSSILVLAAS